MAAKKKTVWGVDVGTSSLKAVKLEYDGVGIGFDGAAYDFVEYPKPTSFPGADEEVSQIEAITEFLGRNAIGQDPVVLGISARNALTRFLTLPPMVKERLETIVAFEAKQQIPFDMDDVYWDWQALGGETQTGQEVMLQAVKKNFLDSALEIWDRRKIHVMGVQATHQALIDSQLQLIYGNDGSLDVPPQLHLHMGNQSTEAVIISNGHLFCRTCPVGGDHFTRAITRDLQLTMAKAEHLKRNHDSADDSKVVMVSALERVWTELFQEITRTIDFDQRQRSEPIQQGTISGGGFLLPNSAEKLAEKLGIDFRVSQLNDNPRLVVAYGLAIAGLDIGWSKTNLLQKKKGFDWKGLWDKLPRLPRIRIEWP